MSDDRLTKKEILSDLRRQPERKLLWTIEEFAALCGTSHSFITDEISKKKIKVYLDDILFIESLKEYIKVVTKEKSILTKFQLSQIEQTLAKENFIRVHRSFIVAKNKIDAFTAIEIEVGGKQIPIGRSYKSEVHSALGIK